MDDVLEKEVSPEDLKKFECLYNEELKNSSVSQKTQFDYAWCLVQSRYPADVRKGIILFEDLYNKNGENQKRDCLYYLAIGNTRIKEYTCALSYTKAILNIEPSNSQVQKLDKIIKKRMEKEGLTGIAIFAGIGIGIATVLGLGIAMAKKH